MSRRALLAVVLATTMVLAGCQFGGSGTPTVGPTDAATPSQTPASTPTPTATSEPFGGASPPPGVDDGGVTDPDALMDAHAAGLDGVSTTVEIRFYLSVNGSNQSRVLRAKVLPGEDRGWMRAEFDGGVGTYYTADGTTYYREVVDGQATYGTTDQVSAVPERERFGADERARTAIESADWAPAGTVERNGRTLFEFRATAVEPPNVDTENGTTVTSRGRLLVDGDGVVHHVSVETTVETDGGTVRYGSTVSLSDVGATTVERPDWVDDAEDA